MCPKLAPPFPSQSDMITSHYSLVHLPDDVSYEQAAPLICAGATVWNAIKETGLEKAHSKALVGIGGLGVLCVQFAKALGYRVVAYSEDF
ncbi:hypothetical protein LZL87_012606 [Fusarium oxysporum]|nr:hypothetical protein LZL87_012606 [Fusarium oxysporum]